MRAGLGLCPCHNACGPTLCVRSRPRGGDQPSLSSAARFPASCLGTDPGVLWGAQAHGGCRAGTSRGGLTCRGAGALFSRVISRVLSASGSCRNTLKRVPVGVGAPRELGRARRGGSALTGLFPPWRRLEEVPLEVLRQRESKWLDMLNNWDKWMAKKHKKVSDDGLVPWGRPRHEGRWQGGTAGRSHVPLRVPRPSATDGQTRCLRMLLEGAGPSP